MRNFNRYCRGCCVNCRQPLVLTTLCALLYVSANVLCHTLHSCSGRGSVSAFFCWRADAVHVGHAAGVTYAGADSAISGLHITGVLSFVVGTG
jgi:hypothetical protein